MSRLLQIGFRAALLLPLGIYASGCAGDDEFVPPPVGSSDFISHVPGTSSQNEGTDGGLVTGGDSSGAGGTTGAPTAPGDDDGGEAERLISEADIIKVDGTKLYALSRYSGLSVIDVADPSNLVLLGDHKTSAVPFEMYVEGDRAYVMYNGWYTWEVDAVTGSESWQTTSRIQALDISNPADIVVLGQYDTPGDLSDSRKVGDVLYLVTYENGYCWNCEQSVNTRVTSFNVADPDTFQLIDELRIVDPNEYGGPRSISVTQERIYVSGQDWGQSVAGVIDVVDIADPAGDLVRGAAVPIAGPIASRWQIDEFEGTLRVISQPGGWGTDIAPAVETFQVTSSSEITKLAKLDVVLPPNEVLQSVRFDGNRAYAITFVQTDPLFTFDLSDPAAPVQVGELEIPGWVYHMEPRGDRIYALGYDNANESGSLHVSLFDVSNLAEPTQLARVNFGGDWANFAEDQNRIHKAFNILADEGLILVPFAGWDYDETATECYYGGSYQSGIQLIDMTEDSLTLRGVAPQVGQARRGFLVGDTLMGVSDNAVQTFDISDRDAPATLGRLELARNISSIRVMGNTMLRFGSDWWTDETTLDFARLSDVDQAEPLGDIDLSEFAIDESECNGSGYWDGQVLVQGGYAYVPRRVYNYGDQANGYIKEEKLVFYIVDLRDRENPTMAGTFEVTANASDEYLSGIVKTDNAILVGHVRGNYYYDQATGSVSEVTFTYDVISLADPAAPAVVAELEMPTSVASGGFGHNFSGCAIDIGWGWWGGYYYGYYGGGQQALVSGDIVASQHQKPLADGSGRVRYYLDQIDVSDPANPVLLPPVNIPGGLIDFNHESGRVVTMDYSLEQHGARDYSQCQHGYFDGSTCKTYRRIVHTLDLAGEEAVLIDSALIDQGDSWANGIAATDTRVFASYSTYVGNVPVARVRTLALGADGDLESLGEVAIGVPWGNLVARGDRAFISTQGKLTVVDSADPGDVTVTSHEMAGYYCEALEVAGDTAYCALGYPGVQAFELE